MGQSAFLELVSETGSLNHNDLRLKALDFSSGRAGNLRVPVLVLLALPMLDALGRQSKLGLSSLPRRA